MGPPTGRQTRWGKAGAPQRGGLPGVKRRVSTSQAEAAPAVTVGRHEVSGGCYGRKNAPLDGRSSGAWGSLREGIQPAEDLFEEQQGGNKAGDLRDGEGEPDVLQHAGERKEIRHRDEDDQLTPE